MEPRSQRAMRLHRRWPAGRVSDRRPALRRSRRVAGIGRLRADCALGGQPTETHLSGPAMQEVIGAFLLGFPAMLSIAHPIGGAFAFAALTDTFSPAQRERVARLVGCYTLVLTLVALWTGSFVLGFFSITLP